MIIASTCTRQLLIRVGDDLNKWIREGFHSVVVQHPEEDQKTMQAMSQPMIACGEDRVFHYSGGAFGVRDKIVWEPDTSSWILKVSKPKHDIADFCLPNSLHLKATYAIVGDGYKNARGKSLVDACVAWNAIDGSQKHRIRLPAAGSGPSIIQLVKVQKYIDCAALQSDSDMEHASDSESED